jgi:hypothetical protein
MISTNFPDDMGKHLLEYKHPRKIVICSLPPLRQLENPSDFWTQEAKMFPLVEIWTVYFSFV